MTATRQAATLAGTVTHGAVIWDGSQWVNSLVPNNGLAASIPPLYTGTGTPEGAVTATTGSLYTNTSGGASTTLYVKTSGSGNTGWTAK